MIRAGRIQVWDLPVRLFHWLLVASVSTALTTELAAPESWMGVHIAAGTVVVLLLVFRLVWGVFGGEYSRIASFLYSPRRTFAHLRGLALRRPPHYLGHNPTGAVMIFALMAVLTGLVATGLVELGGEEKQGPLAGILSYALGNGVKPVHKVLAYAVIGMILFHVAGVLVEGALTRAPLIRAMFTGWKPVDGDLPPESIEVPRAASPKAAALWFAAIVLPGLAVLALLWQLPPTGVLHPLREPLLDSECGACHRPFHPSLLPRASWAALMANLSDHFGEDASLPPDEVKRIGDCLQTYAAEAWDTEAAHRFSVVSPDQPLRITETPYWRRKHAHIDPAVFARKEIGAKSNCGACHGDAATGRFDDQAIRIPIQNP